MENILTIHVNCTEAYEVRTPEGTSNQVLFDGTAEGPYFNGIILPGGVDTQLYAADGSGHLSARYTLEGTDCEGQGCRIFIVNEAIIGEPYTYPRLLTDSKAFSWVNKTELKGTIDNDNGLTIRIFK